MDRALQLAEWLLDFLRPPPTGDKRLDRHNRRISRMTWLNSLAIVAGFLAAANQLPFVSGVAQKADFTALQLVWTEDRLPTAVFEYCRSWRGQDQAEINRRSAELAVLLNRYKSLTGDKYPLADCQAN